MGNEFRKFFMESNNHVDSESFCCNSESIPPCPNPESGAFGTEAGEITCHLDDLANNEAVEALWRHFFPKLVGLAERRMREMPNKTQDEEDVALSAMHSFFAAVEQGDYEIDSRNALWRLLVTITYRKISRELRRQSTQKRGGGVPHVGNQDGADGNDLIQSIADSSQMPEFVEDVHEQCEEMLQVLPDEAMRLTAQMKLEGCSHEEISDVLRCKINVTKERLRKIREIWRRYLDAQE